MLQFCTTFDTLYDVKRSCRNDTAALHRSPTNKPFHLPCSVFQRQIEHHAMPLIVHFSLPLFLVPPTAACVSDFRSFHTCTHVHPVKNNNNPCAFTVVRITLFSLFTQKLYAVCKFTHKDTRAVMYMLYFIKKIMRRERGKTFILVTFPFSFPLSHVPRYPFPYHEQKENTLGRFYRNHSHPT